MSQTKTERARDFSQLTQSIALTYFLTEDDLYVKHVDRLSLTKNKKLPANQLEESKAYVTEHDIFRDLPRPQVINLFLIAQRVLGFSLDNFQNDIADRTRFKSQYPLAAIKDAILANNNLIKAITNNEHLDVLFPQPVTIPDTDFLIQPDLAFYVLLSCNSEFIRSFSAAVKNNPTLKDKFDFNHRFTEKGYNLLHVAAILGQPDLIDFCFEQNVDYLCKTTTNLTPFQTLLVDHKLGAIEAFLRQVGKLGAEKLHALATNVFVDPTTGNPRDILTQYLAHLNHAKTKFHDNPEQDRAAKQLHFLHLVLICQATGALVFNDGEQFLNQINDTKWLGDDEKTILLKLIKATDADNIPEIVGQIKSQCETLRAVAYPEQGSPKKGSSKEGSPEQRTPNRGGSPTQNTAAASPSRPAQPQAQAPKTPGGRGKTDNASAVPPKSAPSTPQKTGFIQGLIQKGREIVGGGSNPEAAAPPTGSVGDIITQQTSSTKAATDTAPKAPVATDDANHNAATAPAINGAPKPEAENPATEPKATTVATATVESETVTRTPAEPVADAQDRRNKTVGFVDSDDEEKSDDAQEEDDGEEIPVEPLNDEEELEANTNAGGAASAATAIATPEVNVTDTASGKASETTRTEPKNPATTATTPTAAETAPVAPKAPETATVAAPDPVVTTATAPAKAPAKVAAVTAPKAPETATVAAPDPVVTTATAPAKAPAKVAPVTAPKAPETATVAVKAPETTATAPAKGPAKVAPVTAPKAPETATVAVKAPETAPAKAPAKVAAVTAPKAPETATVAVKAPETTAIASKVTAPAKKAPAKVAPVTAPKAPETATVAAKAPETTATAPAKGPGKVAAVTAAKQPVRRDLNATVAFDDDNEDSLDDALSTTPPTVSIPAPVGEELPPPPPVENAVPPLPPLDHTKLETKLMIAAVALLSRDCEVSDTDKHYFAELFNNLVAHEPKRASKLLGRLRAIKNSEVESNLPREIIYLLAGDPHAQVSLTEGNQLKSTAQTSLPQKSVEIVRNGELHNGISTLKIKSGNSVRTITATGVEEKDGRVIFTPRLTVKDLLSDPQFLIKFLDQTKGQRTLLHWAAISGSFEMVKTVLDILADFSTANSDFRHLVPTLNTADRNGDTPIHEAAFMGSYAIQYNDRELKEFNSEGTHGEKVVHTGFILVPQATDDAAEPLMTLFDRRKGNFVLRNRKQELPVQLAVCGNEISMQEEFLERVCPFYDIYENKMMVSLIHYAATLPEVEPKTLRSLINREEEDNPSAPNLKDAEGYGPLHYAASAGNFRAQHTLLQEGASIEMRHNTSEKGDAPLSMTLTLVPTYDPRNDNLEIVMCSRSAGFRTIWTNMGNDHLRRRIGRVELNFPEYQAYLATQLNGKTSAIQPADAVESADAAPARAAPRQQLIGQRALTEYVLAPVAIFLNNGVEATPHDESLTTHAAMTKKLTSCVRVLEFTRPGSLSSKLGTHFFASNRSVAYAKPYQKAAAADNKTLDEIIPSLSDARDAFIELMKQSIASGGDPWVREQTHEGFKYKEEGGKRVPDSWNRTKCQLWNPRRNYGSVVPLAEECIITVEEWEAKHDGVPMTKNELLHLINTTIARYTNDFVHTEFTESDLKGDSFFERLMTAKVKTLQVDEFAEEVVATAEVVEDVAEALAVNGKNKDKDEATGPAPK